MLPDIKNFPVNWVDGMKISSQDFISLENAVMDGTRDAQATKLNAYNYGLLPTNHPEVDNYPKLVYDYVKNLLVLKECRALTPAGQRIEITESNYERKKFPAQLPSVPLPVQEGGRYDVYLLVDTAIRTGAGDFAQNNPPRHIAVSPMYELSVRAQDGVYIEQENFLKINELEVRDGRVEILTHTGRYIPPCTTINAFAPLLRLHGNGEERLKGMAQHFTNLINRIGSEARNEVAEEAMVLSERMVTPIISTLSYYRYILPTYAPVFTIVYFKDYARQVRFLLDRPFRADIINRFKPELLELTALLERTEPRHAALQLSFDRTMQLLEKLDEFLNELSKYNYNNQDFDTYDHNRVIPGYRPPAPVEVKKPVEEPPLPPVEPKIRERVF